MSTANLDNALVVQICRDATARSGSATVRAVEGDPLDGSVWITMATWARAREALRALNGYGLAGRDHEDGRLHVTGFDARLLRWRLGVLLAGVDDLSTEWDATAEMVRYHHDRRVDAGINPDPADILADVETAMRGCVPIPHRTPRVHDIDSLLQLIAAAEDAYQQLIGEHIDFAERILVSHVAQRQGAA